MLVQIVKKIMSYYLNRYFSPEEMEQDKLALRSSQ